MVLERLNFKVPPSRRQVLSSEDVVKLKEQISRLLRDKGALLVAHYYTDEQIQILAEETNGIVSDSLDMARFSHECQAETIVVAGVRFMGETAKILNPEKKVLMPDLGADCSLDLGCPSEEFNDFCDKNPDRTVVVYANTSAAVKARADWMVTSGSAVDVVNHLKTEKQKILWAPDKYLGSYVQQKTGADMLMWNGSCVVHEEFKSAELFEMRKSKPEAKVIAHPESPKGVLDQADYIGSTTGLIKYVQETDADEIIVATDKGIFPKMMGVAGSKKVIAAPTAGKSATCRSCGECPWMSMNNLKKIKDCLEQGAPEVKVSREIADRALIPIKRLLRYSKNREMQILGNNDA